MSLDCAEAALALAVRKAPERRRTPAAKAIESASEEAKSMSGVAARENAIAATEVEKSMGANNAGQRTKPPSSP